MAARQPEGMTYVEYLELEKHREQKHEWVDGFAYAMAGGTPLHTALALSIGAELRAALVGKPCRVFGSDLKVRIQATGLATYPDASVVGDDIETHPEDKNAATNPRLLVEVLSESTEAYDRGKKFNHYRQIPSLREMVFVSQDEPLIEVWRRDNAGKWEVLMARTGESVELETTGARLEVDRVYHDPLG
jgi:Uma2 family endonuclease